MYAHSFRAFLTTLQRISIYTGWYVHLRAHHSSHVCDRELKFFNSDPTQTHQWAFLQLQIKAKSAPSASKQPSQFLFLSLAGWTLYSFANVYTESDD